MLKRQRQHGLGQWLGLVGLLCVFNLWAAVMVEVVASMVAPVSGWIQEWRGWSFLPAFYGSHFFGVIGHSLSVEERSLGLTAIVVFWLGLLGSVVVGLLATLLGG